MENVTPPTPATPLPQHPIYDAQFSQSVTHQPPLEIPGQEVQGYMPTNVPYQCTLPPEQCQTCLMAGATASDLSVGHQQNPAVNSSYLEGARTSIYDSKQLTDDAHKKQIRLRKNREAAKECRRKKKVYFRYLESQVATLENQNKSLMDELRPMKQFLGLR